MLSIQLNMNSFIVRNEQKFIASPIGNEVVIMDIEKGSYIGMNAVGVVIWEKIRSSMQVSTLVAELMEEYAVSAEQCEQETLSYLREMLNNDLIIVGQP